MEQNNNLFSNGRDKDGRGDLWYVDNYVLLKDYYDRTISRIAARCVRSGNIALEEYPFTAIFSTCWRKSAKPETISLPTKSFILTSKRKLPAVSEL